MNNKSSISPALRGALYYTIFFGVVGAYFAYVNIVYLERGLTGVQIGILNAVISVGILFSSPILTNLADRKGWHRPILFIGHLVFGLSILGLHFTSNFFLMLMIVAIGSVFSGTVVPLSDMMIVKMANRYELDFGGMRIWGSIGFFIVCTVMGRVWDTIGLENLFLVGGLLFGLRAFSTFLIDPIGKVKHEEHEESPPQGNVLTIVLRDRVFLVFLVACLLWASCWNTFMAYSSIYMDQLGGSSMLVGLMMGLTALGEVPTVFLADRVLRRFGFLPVFIFSIGLFVAVLFAVSRITNPTAMVIVNGLRGIGFGFFIVGGVRYVDKIAPRIYSGTYQSYYAIITFTLPNLVAMPLMGYLFDNYTIQHVFTTQIILGLLAMALFGFMYWQSKRQPVVA
jgi:PPP family 3-phenylpropionic acid transporter